MAQAYGVVRMNKRTKENKRAKENKRGKEVEPDGHGKATPGHELYLHKLASTNPMVVIP